MRNIILVILVTLLSACGGEAFNAEFDSAAGGEAGATDVTAAGGSVTAGTLSTGGTTAGAPMGGTAAGGSSAGSTAGGIGSTGGAPPVAGAGGGNDSCDLDVAALTAALPESITWNSFFLAQSDICATCAYEPCGQQKIAWGEPTVNGNVVTYKPSYAPNGVVPAMTVRIAKNTVGCGNSSYGMCDFTLAPAPISLTVSHQPDGWIVSKVTVTVDFHDSDSCSSLAGKPGELLGWMNIDLQGEMAPLFTNLKFPCN